MIEVKVWNLALEEKSQFPVVLLQTLDGLRRLPIFIGPPEASAIAMELHGKKFQRPLTHDLLVSVLNGLGAKVRRVEITDLREGTYYAKIYLEAAGELMTVDARPSDSIALALKTKARIFVAPHLFESEVDAITKSDQAPPAGAPDDEERIRELKSFLENLDPKDFGRFTF